MDIISLISSFKRIKVRGDEYFSKYFWNLKYMFDVYVLPKYLFKFNSINLLIIRVSCADE